MTSRRLNPFTAAENMMRYIGKKVAGMPATDGAGVKLKRVIGSPALDMIDPFLMLDQLGRKCRRHSRIIRAANSSVLASA